MAKDHRHGGRTKGTPAPKSAVRKACEKAAAEKRLANLAKTGSKKA